jgi:septal ring factor EnvC (AmiA/AmiB activator)
MRKVRISLQAATWAALSEQARGDDSPDDVIARVLADVAVLRDRIDRLTNRGARLRADLEASQAAHGETRRRLARTMAELAEERRPVEVPLHLSPEQARGIHEARQIWRAHCRGEDIAER